jgi:hypothetical protein
MSPDINLGKEVHWNIEDYDRTVTKPAHKFEWAEPAACGNVQVASAMKMNYWLAKGATPKK